MFADGWIECGRMGRTRTVSGHSRLLITGGAGFIGSNFVLQALERGYQVLNVDKLTYAAGSALHRQIQSRPGYNFACVDICDEPSIAQLLNDFQPDSIIHLAAETHVDRSIGNGSEFVNSNFVGTFRLLNQVLKYWQGTEVSLKNEFRFVHVSTDEVYGALPETGRFLETSAYSPNSPYSATKASADHLVRAWNHTYGLPVVLIHPSNNYGPNQHPEKLIPKVIQCCLSRMAIPVFGRGQNVRDWLFVEDFCDALFSTLDHAKIGESYNVGGENEWRNIDLVQQICALVDDLCEFPTVNNSQQLIQFVGDRPGHDFRYAMDCRKFKDLCGWTPKHPAATGFQKTVEWYLNHTERLGLMATGDRFILNQESEQ